jgi:hypothetical protein
MLISKKSKLSKDGKQTTVCGGRRKILLYCSNIIINGLSFIELSLRDRVALKLIFLLIFKERLKFY